MQSIRFSHCRSPRPAIRVAEEKRGRIANIMPQYIYLIHDNLTIRRALRDTLLYDTDHAGISHYSVIPFASRSDFLEAVDYVLPGCVLVQVDIQKSDDGELISTLVKKRGELPIIALCSPCDVPTAVRIIKHGALDVFDLRQSDEDLLEAVDAGFAVLPERMRRAEIAKIAAERVAALTPKELEVLRKIAAGMLSKQIAHEMDLSVRTVEMHRSNMLKRMHVRSMGDCIQMYHLAFREAAFDSAA